MQRQDKSTELFKETISRDSYFVKSPKYIRAGLIVLIFVLSFFFIPSAEGSDEQYQIGDISQDRIVAPFRFDVLKSTDELEIDRQSAQSAVLPVFKFRQAETKTRIEEYYASIENLVWSIQQHKKSRELFRRYQYSDKRNETKVALENDSMQVALYFKMLKTTQGLKLSLNDWIAFSDIIEPNRNHFNKRKETVSQIIVDILTEGVLDIPRERIVSQFINVEQYGSIKKAEKRIYHDLSSAWSKAKQRLNFRLEENVNSLSFRIDYEIITRVLSPNFVYDGEKTQWQITRAVNQVPIMRGSVLKGEIIVEKGERTTPQIYQKLISMVARRSETTQQNTWFAMFRIWMSNAMKIFVILFIFFSFLYNHRRDNFINLRHFTMIAFIILIEITVAWGVINFIRMPVVQVYFIPITFAGMLAYIFFDSRLSMMLALTLSFLIALMLPNRSVQLIFVLISLLTVALANMSIRNLHQRQQIFQAMFFIFGGYLLTIPVVSFMLSGQEHIRVILFSGINAFLIPIITYFIILPLEKYSGRTTDVTLFELSDLRHPLLKRLSLEASGTFQHSIQVANLAEAAAEAIGANQILCRVGAYYHDVGKIIRSQYFIENQVSNTKNPHDGLKPSVSAIVIKNHVKEGIMLAKKYKLPKEVIDFIPMHHGKSLIRFFYQKAKQDTVSTGKIDANDFRYDGPRANTKETGIVMLCEIVEAAVRSLKTTDRNRIRVRINDMITSRLSEGELSDCPLTMLDLEKIKIAMAPILDGIYHGRIEYNKKEISAG